MMTPFYCVGDQPLLTLTVYSTSSGQPKNLSTYGTSYLIYRINGSSSGYGDTYRVAMTAADAAGGVLTYQFTTYDLDRVGTLECQIVLTDGSGYRRRTSRYEIPIIDIIPPPAG